MPWFFYLVWFLEANDLVLVKRSCLHQNNVEISIYMPSQALNIPHFETFSSVTQLFLMLVNDFTHSNMDCLLKSRQKITSIENMKTLHVHQWKRKQTDWRKAVHIPNTLTQNANSVPLCPNLRTRAIFTCIHRNLHNTDNLRKHLYINKPKLSYVCI